MSLQRRDFLKAAGLAACSTAFPLNWVSARSRSTKKILMFTRSVGFQHDAVNRNKPDGKRFLGVKGELAHAEYLVTEWGKKHGFDVTCTKDGRVFIPEELAKYDAFFFYTQGDLCSEKCQDGSPPMTQEGKKAFLDAIASGKGYIGTHCASDTFHSKGDKGQNQKIEECDPYIQMVGGEFIVHGEQFKAKMVVTSKTFPAVHGLDDFNLLEEWYSLKNFAPDLHVVLAEDNSDATAIWRKSSDKKRVETNAYHIRPRHPATWARKHGQGRVFYSSMGHREDVWTNETFQKILLGGIAWALGNVDAEIPPNLIEATPHADVLKQ